MVILHRASEITSTPDLWFEAEHLIKVYKERRLAMGLSCQESVSKIRNRDSVLTVIIPKILRILCAKGSKLHGFGGRSVQVTDEMVLSASRLGTERIMLSVYDVVNSEITKVFSAHVNDFPGGFDPEFFRYLGGRVAILSWRRGRWEDAVMADPAPSPLGRDTFH